MEDRMSHYRGYFMQDENIVAPANIDATDDAGALAKASDLLSAGQFLRVEVWQGPRIVGALSAAAPSQETDDAASNIVKFRARPFHWPRT
jgi:hypothetical protein